jgi:hypothetical protein
LSQAQATILICEYRVRARHFDADTGEDISYAADVNLARRDNTKNLVWHERSCPSTFLWKPNMKLFASSLIRKSTIAAGLVTGLALSAPASLAQTSPFAGFAGSWSGKGTVSLADGSNENIRCKASYRVDVTGTALKQNLRCASDSYQFDLSSDVVSDGAHLSGNWSEASRNLFGSVRGRAGGGEIEVFVEAAGFAANLTVRTRGNRQSVSITSKGEIRNVSITMARN